MRRHGRLEKAFLASGDGRGAGARPRVRRGWAPPCEANLPLRRRPRAESWTVHVVSGRGPGGGRCSWEPRLRCPSRGTAPPEPEVWGQRLRPEPAGPAEQWTGQDSRGQDPGRCRPQLTLRALWNLPTVEPSRPEYASPRLNSGRGHSRFLSVRFLSPSHACVSACLSEHLCHPSVCIRPYLSSVFISHLPSVGPLSVSITYQLSVPTVCIYPLYHLCLSALDTRQSIATCGRSDTSPLRATGCVT